jgi:periplasmic divalent cation tolerance protein
MTATFVYMTAKDREEALKIGRSLVEARLAACVNVLDGMTSLYRWDDEIQEDQETVLVAKTTETLVEALIERVRSLHSYDCPCIVTWPIHSGNAAYLQWIADETQQSAP